eukprot:GHVR01108827.1.p1 GENE.GHVR01108827.1~~GHVR01108827.1.p1  ORF type:complete len:165 (+),score=46.72 GHVR01108827.1:112-606(+)
MYLFSVDPGLQWPVVPPRHVGEEHYRTCNRNDFQDPCDLREPSQPPGLQTSATSMQPRMKAASQAYGEGPMYHMPMSHTTGNRYPPDIPPPPSRISRQTVTSNQSKQQSHPTLASLRAAREKASQVNDKKKEEKLRECLNKAPAGKKTDAINAEKLRFAVPRRN